MNIKNIIDSFNDKGYALKIMNRGLKGFNVKIYDSVSNKVVQCEIVDNVSDLIKYIKLAI